MKGFFCVVAVLLMFFKVHLLIFFSFSLSFNSLFLFRITDVSILCYSLFIQLQFSFLQNIIHLMAYIKLSFFVSSIFFPFTSMLVFFYFFGLVMCVLLEALYLRFFSAFMFSEFVRFLLIHNDYGFVLSKFYCIQSVCSYFFACYCCLLSSLSCTIIFRRNFSHPPNFNYSCISPKKTVISMQCSNGGQSLNEICLNIVHAKKKTSMNAFNPV